MHYSGDPETHNPAVGNGPLCVTAALRLPPPTHASWLTSRTMAYTWRTTSRQAACWNGSESGPPTSASTSKWPAADSQARCSVRGSSTAARSDRAAGSEERHLDTAARHGQTRHRYHRHGQRQPDMTHTQPGTVRQGRNGEPAPPQTVANKCPCNKRTSFEGVSLQRTHS